MQKPEINQTITLSIHNLGSHGEGVGRKEGYTIFVEGALPDEVVEATLTEQHKNYGRANLLRIVKPSLNRVEPVCTLFGTCGGCQLMHLAYPQQLKIKQQRVSDAFQRIGMMENVRVEECLPSPSPLAYRNKIQLPVREGPEGMMIGLYAASSHEIVEIESCHIHCPLGEKIYKEIHPLIKKSSVSAYDPATGKGELRHLLIKSAVNTGEVLIVFITNGPCTRPLQKIAAEIMALCPEVKGVVNNINTGRHNVILGPVYQKIEGNDSITESLCGMRFKISAASFFQVNPAQAEHLYEKALEYCHLDGSETVLDAYCGVGTLSLAFAKQAKKVIGIECVPEAIENAKENAILNAVSNVSFICANSEAYINQASGINVVVLNPPRKGCDPRFLEGIKRLRPVKIVYISCDPATLARDIAKISSFGYKIIGVQPYDMFPQTAHVETVVMLTL